MRESDMMRLADRYRRELREDHKPKQPHVFYTADDFTPAEIENRNRIAVWVIEQGYSLCKYCGESDMHGRLTKTCP